MKQCFKCGETKDLAAFYRHPRMADGHLGKCKECTKRDVKARYDSEPEKIRGYERKRFADIGRKARVAEYRRNLRLRHPEKYAAWVAVGNAIRDGRLIREPCQVCGTTEDVEAHHEDYSRPLDVRWLCFKHHREAHGQRVYTKSSA